MARYWEHGWALYLSLWTGECSLTILCTCCGGTGAMRSRRVQLTWSRDREWQKWPVTIVTGAYIGYAIGKLLGGTLLKGKKVLFDA